MAVAIYARVSTVRQFEKDLSIRAFALGWHSWHC